MDTDQSSVQLCLAKQRSSVRRHAVAIRDTEVEESEEAGKGESGMGESGSRSYRGHGPAGPPRGQWACPPVGAAYGGCPVGRWGGEIGEASSDFAQEQQAARTQIDAHNGQDQAAT